MSEKDEHASEDVEAPTSVSADNSNERQTKSETGMIAPQSETALLEDEEMPSYISVSTPSRLDNSDAANVRKQSDNRMSMEAEEHSRSPCPSDVQGGGSVYVLSSGEESDRPPFNDDDEDEYGDSEDMDELELERDRNNRLMDDDDDDEEDEDEENPLRMQDDDEDEEEIDTECETEYFERASDDFVLTNRLKQHQKKRGLSLQDLSVCKNNTRSVFEGKRHSLNVPKINYMGFPSNYMYSNFQRRSMPTKYKDVESKVKRYIKDIKEQNRRSVERRMKDQEQSAMKTPIDNKDTDSDEAKPATGKKMIKGYVERAIKDLEIEESCKDSNVATLNPIRVVENGQDNKICKVAMADEQQCNSVQRDIESDVQCDETQNEKNLDRDDKIEKRNGSVEVDMKEMHLPYQIAGEKNLRFPNINEQVVNGHQQNAMSETVFNLCTLSYEEYMRGSSNSSRKPEHKGNMNTDTNERETYNDTEIISVPDIDNSNAICALKIENVKSIGAMSEESKDDSEPLNFGKANQGSEKQNAENIELAMLRSQLNQKSAQFNNLQDAYQRVLSEYLKMKQKLEDMQKTLTKYEEDNRPRDTKAASVQTETTVKPVLNQDRSSDTKQLSNKVSTSSMGSTTSSVGRWTDTACSPAISMDPPDLRGIIDSEDSIIPPEGTPRKQNRPLSQVFITSSRILQTLSNITQAKAKPESPLVRSPKKRGNDSPRGQSKENDSSTSSKDPILAPPSAKKRKATDMLGNSSFLQPFKIPHTTAESRKKANASLDADADLKFSMNATNSNSEAQTNPSNENVNFSNAEESTANNEQRDNIKYFLYNEDENSTDRSFLIQAEEMKAGDTSAENRVRECGPYLLGNLEVRMCEVNGTINIWGKEISKDSSSMEHEEEGEVSAKSIEGNACHCWQKSLQTKFNGSQIFCSTSKKPKMPPKFGGASTSQCSHTSACNPSKLPYMMEEMDAKPDDSLSSGLYVPPCENCESSRCCKEWSIHKKMSTCQEKAHACCSQFTDNMQDKEYCHVCKEKQRHDESITSKENANFKGDRRSMSRNMTDCNKHLHESIINPTIEINDIACKHHIACHRSTVLSGDGNCSRHQKCCNTFRDVCQSCRSPANANGHDGSSICCDRTPSNVAEDDPLITSRQTAETHETRQRRLSGKRVRGILMDLFKGCGDCNSSPTSVSKKCFQKKETSYHAHVSPQIKISSCPPEPTCSNHSHSTERCCHAYVKRIESQLEDFRVEMERVRSRSDAILDMLNMLHSVD